MLGAILMARSLATDGFAAYSYFQMTVSMLSTYAALGLGVTASRYFAELDDDNGSAPAPVGTLLAVSLMLGVAAFLLILLLPAEWLNAGVAVPQWLIALGVAVTVAGIVPGGGVLGLEKYRQASLVSLVSGIWMLALTSAAARNQSSLLGMWAIVSSLLIQTLGQLLVIIRSIGWHRLIVSCRWRYKEFRQLTSFAGPMFIASAVAGSGTWIVGRMILNGGGGEHEFSVYSIGLQWFALGSLIPGMVAIAILPRLVRDRELGNKKFVRSGVMMGVVASSMFVIAGYLLAPWLIRLYGNLYANYASIIPVFLSVAALSAPINIIGNGVLAKNGQMLWLAMNLISFLVLMGVLMITNHATVWWAAISHMFSAATMLVMVIVAGKRRRLV